jgi:hypothetical protein
VGEERIALVAEEAAWIDSAGNAGIEDELREGES